MKDNNTNVSGGIGFAGALTIAFIVLKLCGVIDWSWAWVLSPIWISAIGFGVILAIIFIVILVKHRKHTKKIDEEWRKWWK